MIQQILKQIQEFYTKYGSQPHYILMSSDNASLFDNEVFNTDKTHRFSIMVGAMKPEKVRMFHGLTIIEVKGLDRLELA